MASGTGRKEGSVTGTGTLLEVEVGFRPRIVKLLNTDGLVSAEWQIGMGPRVQNPNSPVPELFPEEATQLTYKRITDGTLSATAAGEGVRPTASGFVLGVDTDINVAGEVVQYIAEE